MYAELLLFTLCPRRASQLKSALHVERGIALTVSRLVSIKCGPIGVSWGMQWCLCLSTLHITLPVQPCMVTCFAVGHFPHILSGKMTAKTVTGRLHKSKRKYMFQ